MSTVLACDARLLPLRLRYVTATVCRLARVEEATTQVLGAVARLEQRVQQQQQVLAPRRSSAAAGAVAAEEPLQLQEPAALAGLLSALERVEQQEQDIRERWFGSSSSGGAPDSGSSSACAAEVSKLPLSETLTECYWSWCAAA